MSTFATLCHLQQVVHGREIMSYKQVFAKEKTKCAHGLFLIKVSAASEVSTLFTLVSGKMNLKKK